MQKWSYYYAIYLHDQKWKGGGGVLAGKNQLEGLNALGDDGWELVSVIGDDMDDWLYTFKRPK